MYVAVGSKDNVAEEPETCAAIHEYNVDGTGFRIYASGLRNPVGLAIHPTTGQLYTVVNERDGLGDDLVPDYLTAVREGGRVPAKRVMAGPTVTSEPTWIHG